MKIFLLNDLLPLSVEAWITNEGGRWLLTPEGEFEDFEVPPAPDYSNSSFWSMLPGKEGHTGDFVPPGLETCHDLGTCNIADTFYVHPTTWYTSASWNAPALHPVTAYLSDDAIGPQQGSTFNSAGRVFAPRLRQMAAASFLQRDGFNNPNAKKALAIAYSDVKSAFQHYLDHHWDGKRGIILAGHSQGSKLLSDLLKEYFDNQPLKKYLVAAYLPGWTVFESAFAKGGNQVHVCESKLDTGCVISWRTFARGGDPTAFLHVAPSIEGDQPVCVNPISWEKNGAHVDAGKNLGALDLMHPWTMMAYFSPDNTRASDRVILPSLTPKLADAECINGDLFFSPPSRIGLGWGLWPVWHFATFPGGSWHTYDINLYFANIRANAAERAKAWRSKAT